MRTPASRNDFACPALANPCFQLYIEHTGFGIFKALDALAK